MHSHKFNKSTVHYEVALSIPSNRILAVVETTDSSTSVVTHTSSLAAAAAAAAASLNKQIIKMIPNLTTRRQEQHSYPIVTVKEEPFFQSFESPTESISSSSLDPINTIETNMKEIDSFVFGEY